VKDAASHVRSAPPERWCPRLNKFLVALTVTVIVLRVTYQVLPGVSEKNTQDKQITEAEAELDSARMINNRLTREVNLLRNDSEYLSLFARDKVDRGYMKAGETIFRIAPRQ
jgi:cell division protein FtsB